MEYGYEEWVPAPGVQIIQQQRPARRERMVSERPRHGYWQGESLIVPGATYGQPLHRSASTGARPANIIINNEMDQHQQSRSRSRERPRARSRSRSRARYDDEYSDSDSDWDEREHERRRRRHTTSDRSPSPYTEYKIKQQLEKLTELEQKDAKEKQKEVDYKTKRQLEKLSELEQKEAREKQREEIRKEMLIQKAKEDLAAMEKKKKEDEIKKKAIEDYNREQAEKAAKAKKEKEEADKKFEERVKSQFLKAGYTEEEAVRVLKGKKKEESTTTELDVYDRRKATFVKVHRKYLLPETLEEFRLPWDWDERDGNYIIIKRWIDKDVQDELFEHTRKIKERKLIAYETPKKQEDKLYIVRKKSPSRRSWMFT